MSLLKTSLFFLIVLLGFPSKSHGWDCDKGMYLETYDREFFLRNMPKDQFMSILNKADKKLWTDFDLFNIGFAYMLGEHVDRDLHKSLEFFGKVAVKSSELQGKSPVHSLSLYYSGMIKMLCLNYKESDYEKDFYSALKLGSKDAEYFYSVSKYYRGEYNKFEFLAGIESSLGNSFPLAIFELYYLAIKNVDSLSTKNLDKAKSLLLKSEFFISCDFYEMQRDSSMPYHSFYKERLAIIKNINKNYFNQCSKLKGD